MKNQVLSIIFESSKSERLDAFLVLATGFTRSLIQKNIKAGCIRVNSKVVQKTGHKLESGDKIEANFELLTPLDEAVVPENIPLQILYEDNDLAVINKQAGLIVHPTDYLKKGTLVNALLHHFQESQLSSLNDREFRPGIVHRLDKDTSGLMLIAKNNESHLALSKQLADHTLGRIYWAIATGKLKEFSGTIEAPIGRHPVDRKKMAVIKDESKLARFARTHWETLNEFKNATLVKIKLQTGRTHQIRVHFEHIGYPLLGDPIYGGKRTQTSWISRQCLHAKEIQFVHPTTEEKMHFTCELPEDFLNVLQKLEKLI